MSVQNSWSKINKRYTRSSLHRRWYAKEQRAKPSY